MLLAIMGNLFERNRISINACMHQGGRMHVDPFPLPMGRQRGYTNKSNRMYCVDVREKCNQKRTSSGTRARQA